MEALQCVESGNSVNCGVIEQLKTLRLLAEDVAVQLNPHPSRLVNHGNYGVRFYHY